MTNISQHTIADVEIIEREIVYRGYFQIARYQLRFKLFKGGWSKIISREVFERGHAAAVLLYDPNLKKVVLTEQLRIGAFGVCENPWMLGLVAGIIEAGETAEEVVRRETLEEAGGTVAELIPIHKYFSSVGGSSESMSLFCAKIDATKFGGIHGLQEEGEDIKIQVLDVMAAFAALDKGLIQVADATIALQWLRINLDTPTLGISPSHTS